MIIIITWGAVVGVVDVEEEEDESSLRMSRNLQMFAAVTHLVWLREGGGGYMRGKCLATLQSSKLLLSARGKQRGKVLEVFAMMEVYIMVFPDDGDTMLLLDVDIHLADYTVSHRRKCKTKGNWLL
jgi:hypothetical protein